MRKSTLEAGRKIAFATSLFVLGNIDALGAACDFSPLRLPEKAIPVKMGIRTIPIRVAGRLEFNGPQNSLYAIREITLAKMPDAPNQIARLIADEVGPLPSDDCGARASLGQTDLSTSNNALVISVPLHAEKWGCFIGVKALVASGTLIFRVSFTPQIAQSKFVLVPTATHSGELTSTIPDIDVSFTQMIQDNLREATSDLVRAVDRAISNIQAKLDTIQTDVSAPDNLKALYHPVVKRVGFSLEAGTLTLSQERQTELREGTTCSVRHFALEKWDSI